MVSSCIRRKSSHLEDLCAREGDSHAQHASRLKQVKRWISSKWSDIESFFTPYILPLLSLIASEGSLILVIDGSETGRKCTTLMLSVIWKDHALPLMWLTKKGEKGHFPEDTHVELIQMTQKIIPAGSNVILLGDGEFDGARLRKLCKDLKWEFVLRTSLDRKVDCGGEMAQLGKVCPGEGEQIVFIEDACQGDNAIIWWQKHFESPIPLLTNMELGEMACHYYRIRFKIENLFKSLKSAGFQLHKSQLTDPYRVQNLIIVVAFAFIHTFCAGIVIKSKDIQFLKCFMRFEKINTIGPIALAHQYIKNEASGLLPVFIELVQNFPYILIRAA
jgi:hypothetical protein